MLTSPAAPIPAYSATDPAPAFPLPEDFRARQEESEKALFGDNGFSFQSILDVINPLQHLPIVSNIYREMTGEGIAPGPRLMGGALFGGLFGFIGSLINVIVAGETGKDIGQHVMAALAPGSQNADEELAAGTAAADPIDPAEQPQAALLAPAWIDPDTLPLNTVPPQRLAQGIAPAWIDPDKIEPVAEAAGQVVQQMAMAYARQVAMHLPGNSGHRIDLYH